MSRSLRIILAVLSFLVGIAGIFLPILQAWLFFGMGLVLLTPDVPLFQKWVDKIARRFPRLGKKLRKFQEKIQPKKKNNRGDEK